MKHIKTTIAALAIAFAIPSTASAQFGGLFGSNPFSAGPVGSTLTGAGAGAGIGALLAPSGRGGRGAAIGAALGGAGALALNSLNQSRTPQFSGQQFSGQQFSGQQFAGQSFAQPQFSGQQFSGQSIAQPYYTGQSVSSFVQGPTQHFVQSTQYLPTVRVAQPRTVRVVPAPPIRQQVINTQVNRIVPLPVAPAQNLSAPVVTQTITLQQPVIQRVIRQPIVTRQYVDQPVQYIDEPAPVQQVVQQQVVQHQPVIQQAVQPSTLCYGGGKTRYDSWGNKIEGSGSKFSPVCGK